MNLLKEIEAKWVKSDGERKAEEWAEALKDRKSTVIQAGKQFRRAEPLRPYISVSSAKKGSHTSNPTISFSLRYQGQEVAVLVVKEKERKRSVKIDSKTDENNRKYFGVSTNKSEFSWDSSEAVEFRREFKKRPSDTKRKDTEHHIESEFLKQMGIDSKIKFDGTLINIQPVLFAGFPLQFPLPISSNTGRPKASRGNIDIVARRGAGKGTKISIWELKKPNATGNAIKQAYIYAVTVLKVLRSRSGKFWYQDIFGFNGKLPSKLTIEAVVAVSIENEKKKMTFIEEFKNFKKNTDKFQIGHDTINLYLAHYQFDAKSKGSPVIIKNKPFSKE